MGKKTQAAGKKTVQDFTREDFLNYFSEYQKLSGEQALIRLMMEYDILYGRLKECKDTVSEKESSFETIQDALKQVNKAVGLYIGKDGKKEEGEAVVEQLTKLREELKSRMDVLLACEDCFTIHEYALNRVQYRFEQAQDLPSDEVMAKQVMEFIFSDDDNELINERLRMVIGEVPMRMARSRYFDMIEQSVSLYRDSDKSALDGFLYMFNTGAMLYQNENTERYFSEFSLLLSKLNALDYENITREEYTHYTAAIEREADVMAFLSDLYVEITEIVNHLIILFSCDFSFDKDFDRVKESAGLVLCGVHALFCGQESEIWEKIGAKNADEKERIERLEEQFLVVEGVQERLGTRIDRLSAALEQAEESLAEETKDSAVKKDLALTKKIKYLSSESTFADLTPENGSEKVTQQIIDETCKKLLDSLKESFAQKGKLMRRAIMASTLERMPMFFHSAQEIFDYITESFAHCEDAAEKTAAKQLLVMIFGQQKN